MNVAAPVGARLVEATMRVDPAPGVSIFQALLDLGPEGFLRIVVHPDNTATVVWYEEP